MGGVCDDQRIMAGRQRVLENVTVDNADPRTLRQIRELLPRD